MAGFFKQLGWRAEVLGYDVVRFLMRRFSIDQVSAAGGWLFKKIGPRTSKHHIAKTGMKLAFPDASDEQLEIWLTEMWEQTGRTFAEFPMLDRISLKDRDNPRVTVEGLEHFEALKEQDKGAVLVSGHLSNWEVMALVICQSGLPARVTYRKINNPYFDARVRRERAAYGIELMIAKSGVKGAKQLFKALNSGQSVALLNDQKFNEGIAIPFFGEDAMTAPGPTRMALKTGAPLIPMTVVRTGGVNFKVTIHPPMKLQKTDDHTADIEAGVKQITEFIEDYIRAHPTQWFWVHRRWPKPLYKK